MVNYRRNLVKNGTYFYTATLKNRKKSYFIDYIDHLRASTKKTKLKYLFEIEAMVVLPEHIHTIWTLPHNDDYFAHRWRLIKSYFTQVLAKECVPIIKNAKGNYNLWQNRYWEHTIKNERDFEMHVNYIHYNPVKHGLVKYPAEWPYSSFHNFVKKGILSSDWSGEAENELLKEKEDRFGE